MIFNFKQFIKEELKTSDLTEETLNVLKQNLKERLLDYKEYLLSNIEIKDDGIILKNFDKVDTRVIIRELNNEFTEEFINELKVNELIKNIEQLYSNKDKDIKKNIRKSFRNYFKQLK